MMAYILYLVKKISQELSARGKREVEPESNSVTQSSHSVRYCYPSCVKGNRESKKVK